MDDHLAHLLQRAGLTLDDVARIAALTRKHLDRVVASRAPLSLRVVERLYQATGITRREWMDVGRQRGP